MRILQIVTYISPDGAYGGPVRVALNQAKALTDLGHEVMVAAAAGGFEGPLPKRFDNFPVHLFPALRAVPKTGFAGLTSPGLLSWLIRAVRDADVVHVHLARDLVTLPAAVVVLLAGKPLVVQTHGMIDYTQKSLAKPLDYFLTRPILKFAHSVLYLTQKERTDLVHVAGPLLRLQNLPNGVFVPAWEPRPNPDSSSGALEVLYLARLHRRKRPKSFVEAAAEVLSRGIVAKFRLVGPDEGEVAHIQRSITSFGPNGQMHYEGPLSPDKTLARLRKCDVYVLPSINEPFPMSVIEAMAVGKPVIITNTCGLSGHVAESNAGRVIDDSHSSLVDAISELVTNTELRLRMGSAARQLVEREFDIRQVGKKLDTIYERVIKHSRGGSVNQALAK
jgi:glycosyltransferase involved in cell wall biosynthesis